MRGWANSKTSFWKSRVIQWIVSILPVNSYIQWDSLSMDSEWTIAWPLTMLKYSRTEVMPFLLGHISISYFSRMTVSKCPLYFTLLGAKFCEFSELMTSLFFVPHTYRWQRCLVIYKQNITHKLEFVSWLLCTKLLRVTPTSQSDLFFNLPEHFEIKWDIQKLQRYKK